MKSILMSINPKWVEKIASGEKTIEVRKTVPKCGTPFKVYMYCTQDREYSLLQGANLPMHSKSRDYNNIQILACNQWWAKDHRDRINGKVVGEFVCDEVLTIDCDSVAPFCKEWDRYCGEETGLSKKELFQYSRNICKGLHVSDLKIYDKSKKLSEFVPPCPIRPNNCLECDFAIFEFEFFEGCERALTRPPQSWCYVEELR